jgi:opacity protein-like surface antigen
MELTRKNMLYLAAAIVAAFVAWLFWSGKAHADPWNGFYVGAGGSYNAGVLEDSLGAEGPGIHGIIGYDARIGRFVPGVFAEYGHKSFDWASFFGNTDVDVTSWVAGGRLGFLVSDSALLFVSAGYTQGDADITDPWGDEESVDLSGYVLGAGADLQLDHGFFLRPEYRLTKYNEIDDDTADASVHSGMLTFGYKFNWAADPLSRAAPMK